MLSWAFLMKKTLYFSCGLHSNLLPGPCSEIRATPGRSSVKTNLPRVDSSGSASIKFDFKTSFENMAADEKKKDSVVLTLRVKPSVAQAFRLEAVRRGLKLNALFEKLLAENGITDTDR